MRASRRPDACPGQRFVRIDISHAVQQLLVEQSRLDGRFAAVEQPREFIPRDLERRGAGTTEALAPHLQSAKTARVDKAQLSPRCQLCHQVRMREDLRFRGHHLHSPSHPQVDAPLAAATLSYTKPYRVA